MLVITGKHSMAEVPSCESVDVVRARAGAARRGKGPSAERDLARFDALRAGMTAAKNAYWAEQAEIQRLAVAGWIARAERQKRRGRAPSCGQAADREDATEKSPVTPGIDPAGAREARTGFCSRWRPPAGVADSSLPRVYPCRLQGLAGKSSRGREAGDVRQGQALLQAARRADQHCRHRASRSQKSQTVPGEELRHPMSQLGRLICFLTTGGLLAAGLGAAGADSTGPVPAARRAPGRALRQEEYNRGLRCARAGSGAGGERDRGAPRSFDELPRGVERARLCPAPRGPVPRLGRRL